MKFYVFCVDAWITFNENDPLDEHITVVRILGKPIQFVRLDYGCMYLRGFGT